MATATSLRLAPFPPHHAAPYPVCVKASNETFVVVCAAAIWEAEGTVAMVTAADLAAVEEVATMDIAVRAQGGLRAALQQRPPAGTCVEFQSAYKPSAPIPVLLELPGLEGSYARMETTSLVLLADGARMPVVTPAMVWCLAQGRRLPADAASS